MNDPTESLTPPTARQVAERALILSALTCRGFIEKGGNDPDAQSLQRRIIDWLQRLALYDRLEPLEAKIINAPLGTLLQSTANQMTWTAEGLAVLAWATGHGELPRHDAQVDPYTLTATPNVPATFIISKYINRVCAFTDIFMVLPSGWLQFRRAPGADSHCCEVLRWPRRVAPVNGPMPSRRRVVSRVLACGRRFRVYRATLSLVAMDSVRRTVQFESR